MSLYVDKQEETMQVEKSFQIVRMPPRLQKEGWGALLRKWEKFITKYSSDDKEIDFPYWYGERSLTGLFAAAAWRFPDGWSLEEFTGIRHYTRKESRGRGDLWIGIGNNSYTIEAKIIWPAKTTDYAEKLAYKELLNARKQLLALNKEFQIGSLISICYVVPDLNESTKYSKSENIEKLFKELPERFKGPNYIVACYRITNTNSTKYAERIYPGIILIGEVVKWGKN